MVYNQSIIFIQFICLIAGCCTVAWALLASILRIAPRASWRFSIANLLILLGVALYTQRSNEISYLHWFVADMSVLSGLMIIRWGGQHLFKQHKTYFVDVIILTIVGLLMLLVPPKLDFAVYLVTLTNAGSAVILFLCGLDNNRFVRKEISNDYSIWLSIPFFAASLVFTTRACSLIIFPESLQLISAVDTIASPLILWSFLLLLLLLNITLFANALTRLVTRIQNLANNDQLTGLWNRHALLRKLQEVDDLWHRNHSAYSILILDLDLFKSINDTYGHSAGDEVLKHVAKLLSDSLRKVDFTCRYGGEEFLVILPSTNNEQAFIVAEKILQLISTTPTKWQSEKINITASIGCSTITKDIKPEQLLYQTDKAMYQAKRDGRNTIRKSSDLVEGLLSE